MLYIDNPVGTGFSFTGSDDGYARNQVQIGWNLYNFLVQFYQLFPVYLKRPLFLTGVSYAGKYIPALAYRIHEPNKLKNKTFEIPLTGLIISGSWSDAENQYEAYGPLMYNFGMIDQKRLQIMNSFTANVVRLIRNGQLDEAGIVSEYFMGPSKFNTLFFNLTGYATASNALQPVLSSEEPSYERFLARCDVRDALHVGSGPFKSYVPRRP